MDIGSVLARLYRSEISAGVESMWDDGFNVWLGFGGQPVAELQTHSLEEAAAWLDKQARK